MHGSLTTSLDLRRMSRPAGGGPHGYARCKRSKILRSQHSRCEASQHCALGNTIPDIGPKFNEHAGRLEANLGRDARLDGTEAKH